MRSFSSFMSKDEPGGDGEQERLCSQRAPVWWGATPCCHGRPLFSAPAIVWASIQLHCCNRKWVVLPVALEACRSSYGHRCSHSHNPPHLYSSSSPFHALLTFLLTLGYSLWDKCLSGRLPVCLSVWIKEHSEVHSLRMSFRRLPQLLLQRSDGKGKIRKSIVRTRKRKKEPEHTQKKKGRKKD